ncbi:hypothetical protein HIM_05053 [Hirsutella minnesotensis 3608]|uniref:Uncharacterized protein n=1 Tax=Hirsutella minnesotensis 3608 TaxID=1043627 RepID=A0A0F7ZPJ1_9HYPO|nr:hypothetical protein HIM_05053 [Hirsutella minnesotensis 3608]
MDDVKVLTADDAATAVSTTLSAVIHAVAVVAKAFWRVPWVRIVVRVARLIAWPWRLVSFPLSYLAGFFSFLFAPVLHVFAYLLSWLSAVVDLIAGLEMLIDALPAALHFCKTHIPSGCFPSNPDQFSVAAVVGIASGIFVALCSSVITTSLGMYDDPFADQASSQKRASYDKGLPPTSPAWEADWYWTESSTSRLRQPSGLLSQTIHEEDDSDP